MIGPHMLLVSCFGFVGALVGMNDDLSMRDPGGLLLAITFMAVWFAALLTTPGGGR